MGQPVTKPLAHDPDGHGTHTAGTLVGRKVATRQFGVAPEARLASALVIEGGNVIARVLSGLNWLIGLEVRVISVSLGLRGYLPDFLPVVRILRERQVLPVGAVGNLGPGASCSPGNYADVLSVGACDQADGVPLFSSSQRFRRRRASDVPNLIAPGFEVFSCVPGRRYAEYSGTSMATPHVAGLAALLFGAYSEATADQVERAILDSCTLPPGTLRERGSLGIPDGPDALAANPDCPGFVGTISHHRTGNLEERSAIRPVEWPIGEVREIRAMKRRHTDPELRRQLKAADASQDVSAVFCLRFDSTRPPEPEETKQRVNALLQRVEAQTGEQPSASTIFENLQRVSRSRARRWRFIDRLLIQPGNRDRHGQLSEGRLPYPTCRTRSSGKT